MSNTVRLIAIS